MMATLYHAHYGSLTRIAALLIGDNLAAEEIVQDTFASVYRAWRHLRDGEEALDYLRRTVVSRARSHAAAWPGPRGPAGVGQASPAVPVAPLLITLRELPARQREALILKYYADWPDRQIAAAMGNQRAGPECPRPARHVRPRNPRLRAPGWPRLNRGCQGAADAGNVSGLRL